MRLKNSVILSGVQRRRRTSQITIGFPLAVDRCRAWATGYRSGRGPSTSLHSAQDDRMFLIWLTISPIVFNPCPAPPTPSPLLLQPLAETDRRTPTRPGIKLTLGGEPTYVPDKPEGAEWNVAAVGPTKLGYAYALAGTDQDLPARRGHGVFAGQALPGRGQPALGGQRPRQPRRHARRPTDRPAQTGASHPGASAGSRARGHNEVSSSRRKIGPSPWTPPTARAVAVLPLDHNGKRWMSERWPLPRAARRSSSSTPKDPPVCACR